MAYVKTVSPTITTESYMVESINYITREDKAYKVSYNLCYSVTPDTLSNEFSKTRILYNKNDKILGHQLVQSFALEDNITPELAHKIGIDFMQKGLANYQVVMATHTDSKYIHNQFIINSVSPLDGKKFAGNKTTLAFLRRLSDELCYKNNLTVIDKDYVTKYSPLDNKTKHSAIKGKSWKFNLVKDLDTALEKCKDKKDFIDYFTKKEYDIKFTNANITFNKVGEKKSIRADTLARQFGNKYSKSSIEKVFKIDITKTKAKNNATKSNPFNLILYNQMAESEWKRYEKKYKDKIKINNKRFFNSLLFSHNPLEFTIKLIMYIFFNNKHKALSHIPTSTSSHYKTKSYTDVKKINKVIYNIPYKTIINSPGEAVQIKLYSWQIAKLFSCNILMSSKINLYTGTGICTLKTFDIDKVAKALNISYEQLKSQCNEIKNRKTTYNFKKQDKKIDYLVLTKEQVEILKYNCIEFACYPKGEKFNIVYDDNDKEKIMNALYPNRKERNADSFYIQNAKLNKKLREISETTGEKLCYKVVLSNQYKELRKTNIEYAVFRQKDGKYNVVFLESNKTKILNALKKSGGVTNVENNIVSKKNNIKI